MHGGGRFLAFSQTLGMTMKGSAGFGNDADEGVPCSTVLVILVPLVVYSK